MMRYYKLIECTLSDYEGGAIVAACEAKSRRQAERKLKVDGSNAHLYEVRAESRLPANVYDPKRLTW